jgi:hypothetical protein
MALLSFDVIQEYREIVQAHLDAQEAAMRTQPSRTTGAKKDASPSTPKRPAPARLATAAFMSQFDPPV